MKDKTKEEAMKEIKKELPSLKDLDEREYLNEIKREVSK